MKKQKYIKHHADGTIWAKGTQINGVAEGYFEWFRKDGKKLRSGYFKNGKPTGKWTTYKDGQPYKVTDLTGKGGGKKK